MADHIFSQPVVGVGPLQTLVQCSFVTAGTGAVTGFTGQGIVSATRTGVGTFELLLAAGWNAIFPIGLNSGGAAAAQLGRPSIRSMTRSTRKVVVAMIELDAAPVDIETTAVTVYCAFLVTRTA